MNMTSTIKRLKRSPAQRAVVEANALRDARDWPNAAEAYAKAVALDASRPAIWVQYGHALKESGDLATAETAYRRALAIEANNADTHLQLGHLLKISGRPKEAADAYLTALECDEGTADALREIQDLAQRGALPQAERFEAVVARLMEPVQARAKEALPLDEPDVLAAALEQMRVPGLSKEDVAALDEAASRLRAIARQADGDGGEAAHGAVIVFDASDLIHYFRHSRLPTGIQRVQLEIIGSVVRANNGPVTICTIFHDRWVHIPTPLFMTLIGLATSGSDTGAAEWKMATMRLEVALGTDSSYHFADGACLINLGTSWHVDYLPKIREAKRESRIRYIPFVHDLIPIIAPQYVLAELTENYVTWLLAVFDHADLFLTNSNATRSDLIAAAAMLDRALREDDVVVIPLDARFNAPAKAPDASRNFLRGHGLYGQPFVLFVSTIEPRKNHLAALNAWSTLIGEFGARMPKLVCVGGRGWMNDAVFQHVASNENLSRHVVFLHGLSDVELAACYDACLFTLLPSFYEGWGLPVTESLCHGKVPLLSDISSLPEAGGPFAVYFKSGSQSDLLDALRQLIGDPQYRAELERKIASEFRPRGWNELGDQITTAVFERFADADPAEVRTGLPTIRLGAFYPFSRNVARRLRPGLVSGDVLRSGPEWHTPENWGSWTRGTGVEIAGRFAVSGPVRAYVGIRAAPSARTVVTIGVGGKDLVDVEVAESETKWIPFTFDASSEEPARIDLHSDRMVNLATVTNGADSRVVSIGLLGFYACSATDVMARLAFTEALATNTLHGGSLYEALAPAEMMPLIDLDTPAIVPDAEAKADRAEASEPPLPRAGTRTHLDETPITPNATRGDIILLQSSDADVYAPMLAQSARTTQLYCQRHGYRYEAFLGIKRGCLPWHASYNRIDMLMDLIRADFQGWVFYIDADAWIADLDFDLSAYLATKTRYALIAAPAGQYRDQYWNVNNGVVLFNLGHPFTRAFIAEWERFLSAHDLATEAKSWNVEVTDDQGMFHQILDKLPYAADLIHIENKELLNSPWATFVKHAIRAENADFPSRLALITDEIDKVLAGEQSAELADAPLQVETGR